MAVYTELNQEQIIDFLKLYEIGKFISFHGITEGIENSNFFLETSKGKYILTIFEKRVDQNDLPFFINIMKYLSNQRFLCPSPIMDIKKKYLQRLQNKPAIIVSFLKGISKTEITNKECFNVGSNMASMHLKSNGFLETRKNSLSISGWKQLINKCSTSIPTITLNEIEPNLLDEIQHSFNFCKKYWPTTLPQGFIHADLFPDNVFFKNDKISGVIDFYFSCTDILTYDLAIAVNAWCFDKNLIFNNEKFNQLIKGYSSVRNLSKEELFYLPLLSQGAAMRFLLTRLYDWFHTPKNATVVPKKPQEYITKLRYHKQITANQSYIERVK
ncbi:homoserine kinase [Alphaproteobacteria bacterium]|nr:homoserine kinase [Alphaproteobacteria bacterium]